MSKWLEKKLVGDPEERKFRKQVNLKAKEAEQTAFHEAYEAKAIEAAKERGAKKAELLAQKKSQGGGGGIMATLGKIGAMSNAASKSLVDGIEINPNGASDSFDLRPEADSFDLRPERNESRGYGRQGNYQHRRNRRTTEVDIPKVKDPFDIDDY